MLFSQQRGRHQHGDLLARGRGFESGAQRNFSFAKTDVATDEAVHRAGAFHIFFDGDDRTVLIRRFLIGKRILEIFLPFRIRRINDSRQAAARGLNAEQIFGDIADGFFRAILFSLPDFAAQRRQFQIGMAANVLADPADVRGGNVQFDIVGKKQREVIFSAPAFFKTRNAKITRDAVRLMNHEIARVATR